MSVVGEPVRVLVVGWYPSAPDRIAGRFIADQMVALRATGRVEPTVASFEPIVLDGTRPVRSIAARGWPAAIQAAAREGLMPMPSGAYGPDRIPVFRLGSPHGVTWRVGRDHEAVHRERALEAAVQAMRGRIDLVHAHVGYPNGAAAVGVAGRLGVPLVITEHASFLESVLADPVVRERYRRAGLAARRIVAVGAMLADEIRSDFPELSGRLVVIPNTVDVEAFPVVGPASRDENELLWVGTRYEGKGIDTLLRAFAIVHSARPLTKLRLVGRSQHAGQERNWVELAGQLGVGDAVRFDPPVDRAGVVAAMTRAGVFVHPSRRETFGVVAVEALATGLPVVAADSGGVTEILGERPDELGALVPHSDPGALAAGLLDVLARRSTFDPTALRTHVEHRYGAAVVGRQIADLYDDVLRETRSSSSVVLSERASLAEQALPREAERQPDRGPMTPSALVLLVAFNRRNLDAVLARSPAWLIEDVTVVTSGGPVPGALRTVSLDAASTATLNRAALWKRPTGDHAISPLRWVWRLAIRTWWAMRVLPSFRAAVDRELARVVEEMRATVPSGDRRQDAVVPLVVCQSGFDLLAAGGAVRSGRARLAPGSLRWLGDVRWASVNGARRASQADPSSSA